MTTTPAGGLFREILEKCARLIEFQRALNRVACPIERKLIIIYARNRRRLTDDETTMLMQVHGVDAA